MVQEHARRGEEVAAGQRLGEVQDAVVVSLRLADEHPPQHHFGDAGVAGVAHEEGALLAQRVAEGEVVAHDLEAVAVLVFDLVDGDVAVRRLLVQFDVGVLRAADDLFLLLHRQVVPVLQVVHVLLLDDVAAALPDAVADDRHLDAFLAAGALSAVDEAERVAEVLVLEGVDLVVVVDVVFHDRVDAARQLEGDVELVGADVEEHIARGGRRVVLSALKLHELVEVLRLVQREEAVPHLRADAGHRRQVRLGVAEAHAIGQAGQAGQHLQRRRLAAVFEAEGDKQRVPRLREDHGLGNFCLVSTRHGG